MTQETTNELKIPKHLGIIIDGNRTYAKKLAKKPWEGHRKGADILQDFFDWCIDFNIKEITVYTFSMQNFNRSKIEVDYLIKLFFKFFTMYLNEKFYELEKNQVKIKFIGRINMFSEEMQKIFLELEEKTKNFNEKKLNFAMAYGGRGEIVDATKKLVLDIESGKLTKDNVNEETFANYLYLNSEPELIIRTSGQKRTSGFLPWQSTYSEWIFVNKLWPEFTKQDLRECLEEFTKRNRRFGK